MARKKRTIASELASRRNVRTEIRVSDQLRTRLSNLDEIRQAVPKTLDWSQIERALTRFDRTRSLENATPSAAEVEACLLEIRKKATALREALKVLVPRNSNDDASPTKVRGDGRIIHPPLPAQEAAHQIDVQLRALLPFNLNRVGQTGSYEWELEDIIEIVRDVALAAIAPRHVMMEPDKGDSAFVRLVLRLADCWHAATGKKATARKDNDKKLSDVISPFVSFTVLAIESLPQDTKPESSSLDSWSNKISRSLE